MEASILALTAELERLRSENAQLRAQNAKLEEESPAARREYELRWLLGNDGFGDGVWEYDHQRHASFFSKGYKLMLGYGDDEFPSKYETWLEHVHPDDRESALTASEAYLSGKTDRFVIEHRMRCHNGAYKWVLVQGLVVARDPEGQPLISAGTHTDITEMKQAQQALGASRLRLSATISNLQEGVLLEDENRRIVLTNETFCHIFNIPVPPGALVGADCSASAEESKGLFLQEEEFVRRIDELLRRRELVMGDELILKDGRVLRRDFVPIFGADSYIGHLWKYKDVTEQKRAVELLRSSEEKYRGIIENMNLGLLEVDLEERIIYANQNFCQMSGYQSDELLGRVATQVLLKGENQELMDEKNNLRREGVADAYEIATKNKRGELKWWLISGAPLYDGQHEQIGSVGIHLDITHQKQLEAGLREAKQQAEESVRAKELFLANMSHEIRTPLNAIMGMARLLTRAPLSQQHAGYLKAITVSAENLIVIVNDILDLSKIEAGKLTIEQIGFQPAQMLEQVEKTLRFRAEEKGLVFLTRVSTDLPPVLIGDPYRLTQILLNLAGNALKFTETGSVEVRCEVLRRTPFGVVLNFDVVDTGIGIDSTYLSQIFTDFSQEDSSITRKYGGTGLGLSICRRLVDLLGGELRIESEKGRGTRVYFTLRLPLGAPSDLAGGAPMAVDRSRWERLRGRRVLLVEDNEFNRMLARAILDETGVVVTEAENGAVAMDLVRQQTFDLVLMDVQMPVMNGIEATAALRLMPGPRVPIVALTANAVQGERQRCLEAGMDDYLAKPFQEIELLTVLTTWLGELGEPEPSIPLYQLDFLRQTGRGNAAFVRAMLQTFVSSTEQILAEWATASAALDMPRLRALAHKLKPSLTHLRIQQALPMAEQMENWPDDTHDPTPFWRVAAELPLALYPVVDLIRNDLRAMTD